MRILFTKSDLPGSRIIRWALGEPVSHVAILLPTGLVLDSSAEGKRIQSLPTFERVNDVVFSIHLPGRRLDITKIPNFHYDWGAFIYLGLRQFLPFLPKKNLWQTTGMYICSELVNEILFDKELSHLTPYQLYQLLSKEISK